MTLRSATREAVTSARLIVVKVGSSSLTTAEGGLDPARLDALVDAVAARRAAGSQVVLVSSGAIAAGLAPMGIPRRPRDLATQQAAASVGQLVLGHAYVASFARYSLTVGQVLLTADDVVRRSHYRNAQRTLSRLLALGIVPVVNENDTVATEEIRFGDNDRLAALVAHLIGADALVLLSDVDALYDGDPRRGAARRIDEVVDASDVDGVVAGATGASGLGTGGMASKLAAARLAAAAGIPVLLASSAQAPEAMSSASVGTAFASGGRRLTARRFWLAYAAESAGRLVLDDGAVAAVVVRRRSLLAAGITSASGDFGPGDVVELADSAGKVVARGVVNFDSTELPALIGMSTHHLPNDQRREVVHADDLVPLRH
ncbi:glutamate 5-kinase [Actinokineospora xionganensis]|uniref:Glutamate 5-kinase n=1 Tax=Actinokineospora xionganensis TaxID=2684470 RepID=A0ABR7LAF8_9PSEU|nr:glutamate 5-kinase [Actinokineospora xionganensis]MBC6449695.1 glutamate 5-kinase [Actinokineospora xionganensis]